MNVLKPETAESIWPRGPTALARNRETGKDQRLLFFTKSLQTIGKRHRAWQRLLEDDLRMLWPSSRASSSLRMFKSATQCQGPSRGKDPRTRLFAYQLGIHVQDSHQSRTHVELRLLPAESTCGSPMQPCFSVLNIRKDETCGGTWTPVYKIGLLFNRVLSLSFELSRRRTLLLCRPCLIFYHQSTPIDQHCLTPRVA